MKYVGPALYWCINYVFIGVLKSLCIVPSGSLYINLIFNIIK